jgi:hypothetical protein
MTLTNLLFVLATKMAKWGRVASNADPPQRRPADPLPLRSIN